MPHDRANRRLAAHAYQCETLEAFFFGLGIGHGVGRIGVAATCACENLFAIGGDTGDGLPAASLDPALEMAHQCAIEDVVFKAPDEDGRYQAAILASLIDEVIASPYQQDVFEDSRHLVGFADSAEEVFIGLGFPIAETRAGPGAAGAPLFAMYAIGCAEFVFEMERLVVARFVLITNDVVGTRNDTASTTGAKTAIDDLVVEFLPLVRPPDACWLGGLSCAHPLSLGAATVSRIALWHQLFVAQTA